MRNCSIRLRKALKSLKKVEVFRVHAWYESIVETLRTDRAMSKDTGELIIKQSIN